MKLTLLRHGDTAGSRDDLYYGAADIPVLPDSLEMLAERAKTGVYPTAARYYTSGLLRTEQTIRALYGDVAHTQLPGLREMDFGDFEMKSYEEGGSGWMVVALLLLAIAISAFNIWRKLRKKSRDNY